MIKLALIGILASACALHYSGQDDARTARVGQELLARPKPFPIKFTPVFVDNDSCANGDTIYLKNEGSVFELSGNVGFDASVFARWSVNSKIVSLDQRKIGISIFHPDGANVIKFDHDKIIATAKNGDIYQFNMKDSSTILLSENNALQKYLIYIGKNDSVNEAIEKTSLFFDKIFDSNRFNLKGIVFSNNKLIVMIENFKDQKLYIFHSNKIFTTGVAIHYFSDPTVSEQDGRLLLSDSGLAINLENGKKVHKINKRIEQKKFCNILITKNVVKKLNRNLHYYHIFNKIKRSDRRRLKAFIFGGGPFSNPKNLLNHPHVKLLVGRGFDVYVVGYPGQAGFGLENFLAYPVDLSFPLMKDLTRLARGSSTLINLSFSFGFVPSRQFAAHVPTSIKTCDITVGPLLKFRSPKLNPANGDASRYQETFQSLYLGISRDTRESLNARLKLLRSVVGVDFYFGRLDEISQPGDLDAVERRNAKITMIEGDHNWASLSNAEFEVLVDRCEKRKSAF